MDRRLKWLARTVTSLTIYHVSHHLLLCLNSVYIMIFGGVNPGGVKKVKG